MSGDKRLWSIDGRGNWWIVRWIGESGWETIHRPNGLLTTDREDAMEILGPWYTEIRADNMRDLKNTARHEPVVLRGPTSWLVYVAVALVLISIAALIFYLYLLLR